MQEEIEGYRQHKIAFSKRQLLDDVIHKLRTTGWGATMIQCYDETNQTGTILVKNNPLVIEKAANLSQSVPPLGNHTIHSPARSVRADVGK